MPSAKDRSRAHYADERNPGEISAVKQVTWQRRRNRQQWKDSAEEDDRPGASRGHETEGQREGLGDADTLPECSCNSDPSCRPAGLRRGSVEGLIGGVTNGLENWPEGQPIIHSGFNISAQLQLDPKLPQWLLLCFKTKP